VEQIYRAFTILKMNPTIMNKVSLLNCILIVTKYMIKSTIFVGASKRRAPALDYFATGDTTKKDTALVSGRMAIPNLKL
jgi:hypothetical protein